MTVLVFVEALNGDGADDGTAREIFILTEARYTHSCALAFEPVLAGAFLLCSSCVDGT